MHSRVSCRCRHRGSVRQGQQRQALRKQLEVDFVVNQASQRYYIQVAYDLTSPDGAELGLAPEEGVYESPAIALSGGNRTVAGLIESAGLQLQVKTIPRPRQTAKPRLQSSSTAFQLRDAGLNPTLLSGVTVDRTEWSDIKLRDGDEVVILFAPAPMDRESQRHGRNGICQYDRLLGPAVV